MTSNDALLTALQAAAMLPLMFALTVQLEVSEALCITSKCYHIVVEVGNVRTAFYSDQAEAACCAGWYVAAALTGAYKLPSQRERTVGRAVSTAARAWLLAVPVS